jgi:hypothetical protein
VTVRPSRFPAALAGLALAVGLTGCAGTAAPAAAGSSADEASASPSGSAAVSAGRRIEVQVTGGQVSGDTLVITSDVADEVHVHGYDLETELAPGKPAEIAFDATIPGVFEVELHEAGTQLLSLQVG